MTDISTVELRKEINAILKTADLTVISAKKVRERVEKKLNCSLVSRKKEIDGIVMDFIEAQNDVKSESSDEDKSEVSASEEAASSEDEKNKPKKRPQPTARKSVQKKKRKSLNASDSGTESDGGSDSDYEQPKKVIPKKKGGASSVSGGGATTATGRKTTGFTRPYNLSPELSALMGAEALPRHEVVKKVWAMIKERNLYDPKNKQFAICDDELMKVMGVKRFRTFAMLKYLKPHFLN